MGRIIPRKGFTIIELLTVIMVISLIAALIMPAVQRAREAARRAACANNMTQISLAINNYISNHNVFPPGGTGQGFSFLCMLLPYIDQAPLYSSINFTMSAHRPINHTAMRQHVASFICPSDPSSSRPFAATSYAGNGGTGVQKFGYNGTFAPGSYLVVGPQNITDGLSTTALFSEWRIGAGRDPRWPVYHTPVLTKPGQFEMFIQSCMNLSPVVDALLVSHKGHDWIMGDFEWTIYNHVLPIDGHSCLNGGFSDTGSWTAGSFHPGGTHVAYADGHIGFVGRTISMRLWRAISTRSSGDLVDGL